MPTKTCSALTKPRVLNKSKHGIPANAVFVGRPSKYGNPFHIGRDGTRDEVIAKFKDMVVGDDTLIRSIIYELRGKDLVCFCAPAKCHADVLLRIANARLKVLVCGGRDFQDQQTVNKVMNRFKSLHGDLEIACGNAKGADTLAEHWAISEGIQCYLYPANWKKHGLHAGPIRNQEMLDKFNPDYVIAFPGGTGTRDMCRRAKRAGIKVLGIEDILTNSDPLL